MAGSTDEVRVVMVHTWGPQNSDATPCLETCDALK